MNQALTPDNIMSAKKRNWKNEPLVWMLIAFPLIAVVAGLYTFYLAVVSFDGMVVDDYYQRGKEINRVLERDQVAARLQLSSHVTLDHINGSVSAYFPATSLYTPPDLLQLRLSHATRAGIDKVITIRRSLGDTYEAALPSLEAGRWYVQLEADNWRLTNSLLVPQQKSVTLQHDILVEQ